jgi:SAM-dependent methyltransferase
MIIKITARLTEYFSSALLMPRAFRVLVRSFRAPHVRQGLEEVRRLQRQGATGDGSKYLHSTVWLLDNALRVVWLSLERRVPCRILDLGSGAGYFIALARALGHHAEGVDLGEHPIYTPVNKAFGNRITWHRVTAECPYTVPELQLPFDVITAFSVTFDRHGRGSDAAPWASRDWILFFSKLKRFLRPGGMVLLQVNTRTFLGCRGGEFAVFRSGVLREAGFECVRLWRRLVELREIASSRCNRSLEWRSNVDSGMNARTEAKH